MTDTQFHPKLAGYVDWQTKVLHPTRHKTEHFRDILPSQSHDKSKQH